MVNIESLLSPTGGYNYDETVNSGITGLLIGFGLDRGLYDSYLAKPALRSFQQNNKITQQIKEITTAGNFKRNQRYSRELKKAMNIPHKPSIINPDLSHTEVKPTQAEIDRAEKARRIYEKRFSKPNKELKELGNRLKAQSENFKGKLGSVKSLIRGGIYAQLMSFGVEMATEAFTPGISKIARKRETEFMQQGQQDSPGLYTMRQRAIMAIHNSMMTTRNVIGNEAQFMHR